MPRPTATIDHCFSSDCSPYPSEVTRRHGRVGRDGEPGAGGPPELTPKSRVAIGFATAPVREPTMVLGQSCRVLRAPSEPGHLGLVFGLPVEGRGERAPFPLLLADLR